MIEGDRVNFCDLTEEGGKIRILSARPSIYPHSDWLYGCKLFQVFWFISVGLCIIIFQIMTRGPLFTRTSPPEISNLSYINSHE